VSASTTVADLPVQRPKAVNGAPILILSSRIRRRSKQWDGRLGQASGYAGDELGVRVPDKVIDVIAGSWALVGHSSGAGQRPEAGAFVICEDGTLGIVKGSPRTCGEIKVEQDGRVSCQGSAAFSCASRPTSALIEGRRAAGRGREAGHSVPVCLIAVSKLSGI
jgi:hypothetical protein